MCASRHHLFAIPYTCHVPRSINHQSPITNKRHVSDANAPRPLGSSLLHSPAGNEAGATCGIPPRLQCCSAPNVQHISNTNKDTVFDVGQSPSPVQSKVVVDSAASSPEILESILRRLPLSTWDPLKFSIYIPYLSYADVVCAVCVKADVLGALDRPAAGNCRPAHPGTPGGGELDLCLRGSRGRGHDFHI